MKIETKKLINSTLKAMEKEFGKEAIMLLGKKEKIAIDVFSSGSLIIDEILGIGGYPKGRVIELFGPESSGKTTLALHAISEIQKLNGVAAFIDVEHALDPLYAKKIGVEINDLILSQPDSGEQALEIVNTLAKTGIIDLIVVDSVAALTPEVELAGEMKDQTIGAQARLMSKALRKITATLSRNQTTIIFINQLREKIGIMFGNPEVTPGGRALKFFSSIRIDIRRISSVFGDGDKMIKGNNIKVKIVKNKLAPPFQVGTTEILFAHGISQESEIINLAEKFNIINKKGSWYSYDGQNVTQGKEKFKKILLDDKKFKMKLKNQVRLALKSGIHDIKV